MAESQSAAAESGTDCGDAPAPTANENAGEDKEEDHAPTQRDPPSLAPSPRLSPGGRGLTEEDYALICGEEDYSAAEQQQEKEQQDQDHDFDFDFDFDNVDRGRAKFRKIFSKLKTTQT